MTEVNLRKKGYTVLGKRGKWTNSWTKKDDWRI